jgi:hypothetical protein
MCEAHQSLRRRLFWVGTILAVGSVPFGIIVEQVLPQVGDWSLLITAVLLFAGLIIVSPVRQFLRPTFIDKGRSEFKGGAESFLQHLSSTP